MKFAVAQILNLPDMKVLDFQEVEGVGIIITIRFIDVNALLLPFMSLIAPKVGEYILSFIGPRVGKLIIRGLL